MYQKIYTAKAKLARAQKQISAAKEELSEAIIAAAANWERQHAIATYTSPVSPMPYGVVTII